MIRRISLLVGSCVLAICALALLMSGCETPPPPTPPHPDTWPRWTFMVYMNGDNDLENAAIDDFKEMAQVGSRNRVDIVVQMDRHPGWPDDYGDWTDTRRFVIHAGDIPTKTAEVLPPLGERNMGDPAELQDFIEWAVETYPAQHYLLSIWDHGDGWRRTRESIAELERAAKRRDPSAVSGAKAISVDHTDGDVLYMHEVGEALRQAQETTEVKLDIVGFDACLMGMIEVAYEIRNYADVMVGSEEVEPEDGWPYDTILADLVSYYDWRAPRSLASRIVFRYYESYSSTSDITQAAYDLSYISDVTSTLEIFVDTHNDQTDKEWAKIGDARGNTEEYHSHCGRPEVCWGVDLWDFANEVYTLTLSSEIQDSLTALTSALDDFVIAERHGTGHPDSYGVAIYFPPDDTTFHNDPQHTGYEDTNMFMPVAFVQDLNWDNWLREQYCAQFP